MVGSFDDARTVYGIVLESYPQSLEMWKMWVKGNIVFGQIQVKFLLKIGRKVRIEN